MCLNTSRQDHDNYALRNLKIFLLSKLTNPKLIKELAFMTTIIDLITTEKELK